LVQYETILKIRYNRWWYKRKVSYPETAPVYRFQICQSGVLAFFSTLYSFEFLEIQTKKKMVQTEFILIRIKKVFSLKVGAKFRDAKYNT